LARIKAIFPRIQIYIYWCVKELRNTLNFFLGGKGDEGVESDRKTLLRETWIRWEKKVKAGVKNIRG
jgi:hypothetical protein